MPNNFPLLLNHLVVCVLLHRYDCVFKYVRNVVCSYISHLAHVRWVKAVHLRCLTAINQLVAVLVTFLRVAVEHNLLMNSSLIKMYSSLVKMYGHLEMG